MEVRCLGSAPAAASTSTMFCSVWRTCPTRSSVSNWHWPFQPICPPTNTNRPRAAMPLAYPTGLAQPSGCRTVCMLCLLERNESGAEIARPGDRAVGVERGGDQGLRALPQGGRAALDDVIE